MKILSEITSHIFSFIVGVLALCATLTTCVIPISYIENPQNNVKYVALSLIPTVIIGCLLIKIQQVIRQITLQRIRVFALSMIAGIGLLWISVANLHPVWDMQALIDYASSFQVLLGIMIRCSFLIATCICIHISLDTFFFYMFS